MVVDVTNEDVRNIANATLCVGVVLAGTRLPDSSVIDVGFSRRVVEAQESTWDYWNGILQVGDTDERTQFAVNKIGELLVSDLNG